MVMNPMVQMQNQWDYIDPIKGDLLVAWFVFCWEKTGERIRICPGKWTFCTPSHGGLVQMIHPGAFEVNQPLVFRGEKIPESCGIEDFKVNKHQIKCFFGLKLEGQSPNKPDHKVSKRDIFQANLSATTTNENTPVVQSVMQNNPRNLGNRLRTLAGERTCKGQFLVRFGSKGRL